MPKPPQLMINWEERKIFCESCNTWIDASKIRIDGRHDLTGINDPSAHTMWERD